MSLLDVLNSPWAILPEKLREIQAIHALHVRGEKVDLDALEARLGRPLASEQRAYVIQQRTSIAVLEIAGVIAPKANLMTRISGGAVAALLERQVQSMADDDNVRGVVLDIDSPGGNVFGVPALANAVRALADKKPVAAVSSGLMASAAYWIGSAAGSVWVGGVTDLVGSIGVVGTHSYDPGGARGAHITEITAGKYKRIASDNAPLTAEGREYLQERVDELYRAFVGAVADHRGASVEDVLKHMADGRTFVGARAVDAGLADGVATVAEIVDRMDADLGSFARRRKAVFAAGAAAAAEPPVSAGPPAPPEGPTTMPTPQELAATFAAENPEAAALLRAEGTAAGAAAEAARARDVRAQLVPGHEALIERLAADGTTTGAEAAMAVIAAERQNMAAAAASRAGDAPQPVRVVHDADPVAAAAAGAAADPQAAAADLAEQIVAKQREAAANGRTLNAVQALALINKEQ